MWKKKTNTEVKRQKGLKVKILTAEGWKRRNAKEKKKK